MDFSFSSLAYQPIDFLSLELLQHPCLPTLLCPLPQVSSLFFWLAVGTQTSVKLEPTFHFACHHELTNWPSSYAPIQCSFSRSLGALTSDLCPCPHSSYHRSMPSHHRRRLLSLIYDAS